MDEFMIDKFAGFKGNKLLFHGHSGVKGKWYEHNWLQMDCSFATEYYFKLRFVNGRFVSLHDIDGDGDDDYVAKTFESMLDTFYYLKKIYEDSGFAWMHIELLVIQCSNDKVMARKLLIEDTDICPRNLYLDSAHGASTF